MEDEGIGTAAAKPHVAGNAKSICDHVKHGPTQRPPDATDGETLVWMSCQIAYTCLHARVAAQSHYYTI